MLSKKTATLYIIVNSLYILYFLMLMIWLKEPLITDVYKQPVILSNQVLAVIQIVMSLLSLFIFIGLVWILKGLKEKVWIVLAVCIYLVLQLYFNVLSVLNIYRVPMIYLFYNYTVYVNYAVLLFLVIALLFIDNAKIKTYFRWFAIAILLSMIIVRVGPLLYENYNLRWALINPGIIKIIPFFISLFLFIKISRQAIK
jgi:hypothetical protein